MTPALFVLVILASLLIFRRVLVWFFKFAGVTGIAAVVLWLVMFHR